MIEITFPDGSKKRYSKGITALDIAKDISEGLARAALAVKLDDKLVDLSAKVEKNSKLKIITFNDKEGLEIFRHSTAHLLAHAVKELFPYAKPTIGPVVEEGFYYDFDHEPFTPDDFRKIEDRMKEIAHRNLPIDRMELTKNEAKGLFKDNEYKLEMIEEMEDGITAYKQGDFIDLCRGPHVPNTSKLKAFKLTKIAGAYWRGDVKNKQLQRIYGISFYEKEDLKKYIYMMEEARKRDHRIIGKKLDMFSFHDESHGFPFFHPKGMILWNELVRFWMELHDEAGYVEVKTPLILNRVLWEKSGHWENYKENMYTLRIDEQDYAVKPMNCPGGMLIYKERLHSYRELPLRVTELGHVHRHELSGVLAGLFRVRSFHQDDAHLYMTPKQIKNEIIGIIKLADKIYSAFGLGYEIELSTRPVKSIGTDKQWETAITGLKSALDSYGVPYKTNEGDGAFYGPKIDFHIKDILGRRWQCGTIQLDMALPERFDLTYEGKDGKKHMPVTLHRTIYGSLERFIGILVEHYAGKFPLWLSPVQTRILTVADRFDKYADKIGKRFARAGIRVDVDKRTETIPRKVREAQLANIPLILTVGEKEVADETVAVRTLDGQVKFGIKPADLLKIMKKNIKKREQKIII